MSFEKKFRKDNKNLATGSVRTYLSNIRRAAKAVNENNIPEKGTWLKKTLPWLRKQNLNTKKLISAALVKAAQTYKVNADALSKIMKSASDAYTKKRLAQKKTPREKALMPEKGYQQISLAAKKIRSEIPHTIRTMKDFMKLQGAWLVSFYSKHTPRLIEDVQIGKGTNKIQKKKSVYILTLGNHKTIKSVGKIVIKLDKSLTDLTERFIRERPNTIKHNNLLVAPRGGKMSKSTLSKTLTKLFSRLIGKGFSTQILRVLKATSQSSQMKKVREYLNEMGHSAKQDEMYVAK